MIGGGPTPHGGGPCDAGVDTVEQHRYAWLHFLAVETPQPGGEQAGYRYGRALITAMREVLEEVDEQHREMLLETADFWLRVGLVIGLERAEEAELLFRLSGGDTNERDELLADAEDLLDEAIR